MEDILDIKDIFKATEVSSYQSLTDLGLPLEVRW